MTFKYKPGTLLNVLNGHFNDRLRIVVSCASEEPSDYYILYYINFNHESCGYYHKSDKNFVENSEVYEVLYLAQDEMTEE